MIRELFNRTVNYFKKPKLVTTGIPLDDFKPTDFNPVFVSEPLAVISLAEVKKISERLGLDQTSKPNIYVSKAIYRPSNTNPEERKLDFLVNDICDRIEKEISFDLKEDVIELTEADLEYIDIVGEKKLRAAQDVAANGNEYQALAMYKNLAYNSERDLEIRIKAHNAYKTLFTKKFGYAEGQLLRAKELAARGLKDYAASKLDYLVNSRYVPKAQAAAIKNRASDIRQRLFSK